MSPRPFSTQNRDAVLLPNNRTKRPSDSLRAALFQLNRVRETEKILERANNKLTRMLEGLNEDDTRDYEKAASR